MSSKPIAPENGPRSAHRLPGGVMIFAGILLLVPLVALAIVPVYAKDGPHLWGFPFFYWYQFLWVFLASGFTFAAYVVIGRARRGGER